MKKLIYYTLLLFLLTNLNGNQFNALWKQYNYTDGISSNYIFDIEKDESHRIWIGTQNGVTLIDGNKIKKYGLSNGLPASNIIKVISFNNTIYLATSNKRIYVLDDNGIFQKTNIVQASNVNTMTKVGGRLFISTNSNNILFDGKDVSYMGYGFPNARIKDVYTNGKNTWYVSENQLIQKKGNRFASEKIDFPNNKVKIQSFLKYNGQEYFGTNQGLWLRKGKGDVELIKNINVLALDITNAGQILIGSKKGLYFFNGIKLEKYNPTGEEHQALNRTAIYDIEFMSENEIWYATFGMGVYLQDAGTFKNIGVDDGIDSKGMIFDMASWEARTYVATKNGLFVYKNNKIKKHFTKTDGLPSNIILDLDFDGEGNLWLATSNGLSKYSNNNFYNLSKKDGLPSKLITAVHVDRKNNKIIWSGSENSGLTRFDSKDFFTFSVQDGLPSNSVRDITQLENGELIIACYKAGVVQYNGEKFQLFDIGLDDKRVIKVTNGPRNSIWAGTESAGIGVLENEKFRMIRDSDGLGHNEIFSLYFDGEKMWAGTFGGGVSCLSDDTWFTLKETDGLISNTIGAIISGDKGQMIIGGNSGLSIFTKSDVPFKIHFDNILTPKAEISFDALGTSEIGGIVDDRFYMTANPLVYNPANADIRYRTRIQKVRSKEIGPWSKTQLSPQISFIPEKVGSYEFQIQALDNRLILSDIATIPFNIGRIWYLDPKIAIPFWGGILLLFGFSIFTYINYLKKSKEAKDLKNAEIERQQAEMEEARQFQKAMLPKEMPTTDEYEMVGFQQTATEVGGDFYDFMQKEDRQWVAICGDATGHGLTSGNVVSITKTAMSSLVNEEPVSTLDSLNTTLLKMNIGLNRMCLNIANIEKDSIKFSSAGMPPAYYYSVEKDKLEEVLVGALPLGSFPGAIHTMKEIPFKNKGDLFIMMSDGLPEAENVDNEMVGYDRTLEKIKSLSTKSADEIKDGLVDLCNNWLSGGAELKDDMTFVIIKKK